MSFKSCESRNLEQLTQNFTYVVQMSEQCFSILVALSTVNLVGTSLLREPVVEHALFLGDQVHELVLKFVSMVHLALMHFEVGVE